MTFKDRTGGKHILPSNPVCLCVPRFVSICSVLVPSGLEHNLHAGRIVLEEAAGTVDVNQLPIRVKSLDRPDVVKSKARVDVDVGTQRVVTVYNREGTRIGIGRHYRPVEAVSAELPPERCCDEPLTLVKSCSTTKHKSATWSRSQSSTRTAVARRSRTWLSRIT